MPKENNLVDDVGTRARLTPEKGPVVATEKKKEPVGAKKKGRW